MCRTPVAQLSFRHEPVVAVVAIPPVRSHSRREMCLIYEGRTTGPPGRAVLVITWRNDDAEKGKLRSPIRE
jgi:hypothetical protein